MLAPIAMGVLGCGGFTEHCCVCAGQVRPVPEEHHMLQLYAAFDVAGTRCALPGAPQPSRLMLEQPPKCRVAGGSGTAR